MTVRPILFSAPMVKALLAGRKTQTRRVLRVPDRLDASRGYVDPGLGGGAYLKAPTKAFWADDEVIERVYPFCEVGDLLWVRETWRRDGADSIAQATADFEDAMGPQLGPTFYKADHHPFAPTKWWPGIHMPRWASRLTLEVTETRVQRLQEISDVDAIDEGVIGLGMPTSGPPEATGKPPLGAGPRQRFSMLWDSINGKRPGAAWTDNPWIVAITFKVHRGNVDTMPTTKREVAA